MTEEWKNSSAQEPTAALHGVRPPPSIICSLSPGHSFPKHSLAPSAYPVLGGVDRERKRAWPGLVLQLTSRRSAKVREGPHSQPPHIRAGQLGEA